MRDSIDYNMSLINFPYHGSVYFCLFQNGREMDDNEFNKDVSTIISECLAEDKTVNDQHSDILIEELEKEAASETDQP